MIQRISELKKTKLVGIVAFLLSIFCALLMVPQPVKGTIVYVSDNFSSYNFVKWSGVSKSYLETAKVIRGRIFLPPFYAYYYYARFTSDAAQSYNEWAYCYKKWGQAQEMEVLSVTGKFRVISSGMVEDGDLTSFIEIRGDTKVLAYAGWRSVRTKMGSVVAWYLVAASGTGYVTGRFNPILTPPSLNRWYTIQLRRSATEFDGNVTLAVDGRTLFRIHVTTYQLPAQNEVRLGLPRMYRCGTTIADLDDALVTGDSIIYR